MRTALRATVAELQTIRDRLAALRAGVPPSAQEISEEDLPEELDFPTEIRAVLASALQDDLDPLIANLTAAAEYRRAQPVQPARPAET